MFDAETLFPELKRDVIDVGTNTTNTTDNGGGIGGGLLQQQQQRYMSPITYITQEIRRKNGSVAFASVASGNNYGLQSTGGTNTISAFNSNPNNTSCADPWDESLIMNNVLSSSADLMNEYPAMSSSSVLEIPYEDEDLQQRKKSICTCPRKRRTSSNACVTTPFSTNSFKYNNVKSSTQMDEKDAQPHLHPSVGPKAQEGTAQRDLRSSNSHKVLPGTSRLICPRCSKKRPIDSSSFSWYHSSQASSPSAAASATSWSDEYYYAQSIKIENFLDEPRHAESLLYSTPQLRFLSPASINMQGFGNTPSANIFLNLVKPITDHAKKFSNQSDLKATINGTGTMSEYRNTLIRYRANRQAAMELSSLMWLLAHEMSIEDYGTVESDVFKLVFALVHATEKEQRMAGLAALDALLSAPSADEEKKSIKFANALSNGLRAANGDFEFLSAISKALGHMARRTSNVDFVESEVTRALEWLRTDRSDRRLAATLSLKEFAMHLPTTFHSKTSNATLGQGGSNEFLDHIFHAIRDPQPIVRACATDALSQCLKILVERRHLSLVGLLCQVYFNVLDGLKAEVPKQQSWQVMMEVEASRHGSLLAVASMLEYTQEFMLPRYEEICKLVLACTTNSMALVRLEVVRLIPRLAQLSPRVFGRRYLERALLFLIDCVSKPLPNRPAIDIRPSTYTAFGQLGVAMTDEESGEVIGASNNPTIKFSDDPTNPGQGQIVEMMPHGIIYEKVNEIFALVSRGLHVPGVGSVPEVSTFRPALYCAASLVEALGELALPYVPELIDNMFRSGLSHDLIHCLHLIAECVPEQQEKIEERMLQGVSICLTGSRDVYDPLAAYRASVEHARAIEKAQLDARMTQGAVRSSHQFVDVLRRRPQISLNMESDESTVRDLCLSLQTLASFGGTKGKVNSSGTLVPLLPFVQDVVASYLSHPVPQVRRDAALTCCALLLPRDVAHTNQSIGSYSGIIIEGVLQSLLRTAVSDTSVDVRHSVIRALDYRYTIFLCQSNHLQELFLLLQDENLSTRAIGLRLLGRLAAINPGPILPTLRLFLGDLILELLCGVDSGRSREDATRLLVVYLRAKPLQRLVYQVLPTLVDVLPLDVAAPPRLASASLEALGELAQATGMALQPRVKDLFSRVLEIMLDRSSSSKQRTSLRTLGQIAGSTGYVIRPYLDFPNLLTQATDILPATKRAPWSLRREVIRTLGILGALDPDRYRAVASRSRKRGAVGGAYFAVEYDDDDIDDPHVSRQSDAKDKLSTDSTKKVVPMSLSASNVKGHGMSDSTVDTTNDDDDAPAYLYMYEQYAMVAQPVFNLPPTKRISPSNEEFYPTVAIQALMRIFRDPSLAVHHGIVVQAVMFIFKSLNLRCVPYLSKVVPCMLDTVKTCNPSNLRESLLKHLATLAFIVKEHLRPYVAEIFDIIEQFWSTRHLSTIFNLISNLAVGVPVEFRQFVPRLIRRLLSTFDDLQVADWSTVADGRQSVLGRSRTEAEKVRLILASVRKLKSVLGDYLNILIPALLKLADTLSTLESLGDSALAGPVLVELSVMVYRTISFLLEDIPIDPNKVSPLYFSEEKYTSKRSSESGFASRLVQPIIRFFREQPPKSASVGLAMLETLCVCVRQIGATRWMQLYDPAVRSAIFEWHSTLSTRRSLDITALTIKGEAIPSYIAIYDLVLQELQVPASKLDMDAATSRIRTFQALDSYNFQVNDFSNFDNTADMYDPSVSPYLHSGLVVSNQQKVNQGSLQRAWDVSQRTSRDDWDEWMRRFAIQLLREAPSPALRATASLAHAYQPLARELFSASFACCWKELSEPYRVNLVHALETAFVANVSPEILQALLNLAEFMEYDPSGGLPIPISVFADLALKCRAYAKALHYKEREYMMGGPSSCIEALISINGKLDLPDAALGVLKAASVGDALMQSFPSGDEYSFQISKHQAYEMFYSINWSTDDRVMSPNNIDVSAKQELWLAKLGSWTEALAVYEEKLKQNGNDFEAIVGCMQCLVANGDWQKVIEMTDDNWSHIIGQDISSENDSVVPPKLQRKAVCMAAQAAWRLGQWGDLEKFSSHLVGDWEQQKTTSKVTFGGLSNRESNKSAVDFDGSFFRAILHVHRKEWSEAAYSIDEARRAMDGRLTALMAESFRRAYPSMVTAQTLAELEEIIEFRKGEERAGALTNQHRVNRPNEEDARERLLSVWRERLGGCRVDAEVHSSILAVRSLILGPADEVESKIALSELSRQSQRYQFAERVLLDPLKELGADINGRAFGFGLSETLGLRIDLSAYKNLSYPMVIDRIVSGDIESVVPIYGPTHNHWSKALVVEAKGLDNLCIQHRLYYSFLRHLWHTDRKDEAITRLTYLSEVVDMVHQCENVGESALRSACWVELGEWKLVQCTNPSSTLLDESIQADVLTSFKRATMLQNCGYKAWHSWALLNFRIAMQFSDNDDASSSVVPAAGKKYLRNHIVAAVTGFANAITTGTKKCSASVQQDLLNLITCLFKYGNFQDVANVFSNSIPQIAIEAWLGVLPQLLARIHIKDHLIRSVLHPLISRLGKKHPQALIYPLSVLVKSPVAERKYSAESLMNSLKKHSNDLVEEALMVSTELIRISILWIETWHEGLDDASKLYFGEGNVSGMLELLFQLHSNLEKGAGTKVESDFLKLFGQDLEQAFLHIKDYIMHMNQVRNLNANELNSSATYDIQAHLNRHNDEADSSIFSAWEKYYNVFSRINKQLISLTSLELSQCSPALRRARSLELGIPGSYRVDGSYVKIEKFIPNIELITSKQRPRKITLRGSDGQDYVFLLKGHEDLRQDERVMQLFGLVNALLVRDPQTRKYDLQIQRYAVSPLSHNCGIVGWVPQSDLLHGLIKDYRQLKKIVLNMENREMLKMAPDYELLTTMQKVEVFVKALRMTTGNGNDLYEILWLKSTNSEEWLERRTNFTRSLAVMSMVGYILGLGDRHPSNLMLDKRSGRILHIDFGDCFEVAMNREKYPERVPFRLTRMLIKAMEVSGIEGSYRSTCERTMSVLRDNRDSLVAMLEAFVHDPLISWRLAHVSEQDTLNKKEHRPRNAEAGRRNFSEIISEEPTEGGDDVDPTGDNTLLKTIRNNPSIPIGHNPHRSMSTGNKARSMQIFSSIQARAASIATDSVIASVSARRPDEVSAAEADFTRSRMKRSMRQQEQSMSLLAGRNGHAHFEALNQKALQVIRRVQDKLSGTDFPDSVNGEPLDVPDQVQRLIVQATSCENLCQLYVGWSAFW